MMRCIICKVEIGKKHLPSCPEARRKMSVLDATITGEFRNVPKITYLCGKTELVRGIKGEPPTVKVFLEAIKAHRESCSDCV